MAHGPCSGHAPADSVREALADRLSQHAAEHRLLAAEALEASGQHSMRAEALAALSDRVRKGGFVDPAVLKVEHQRTASVRAMADGLAWDGEAWVDPREIRASEEARDPAAPLTGALS